MLMYPPLDKLLSKADSKYTLVVVAAKRARQLMAGMEPLITTSSTQPVTVALEEISQGAILYERTKSGIK